MIIVNEYDIYWDNDMECWCFESEESYENAQSLKDYEEKIRKEERKIVCDAVYKLTRELLSFGFKTVSIEDVENVIKQFDEEE